VAPLDLNDLEALAREALPEMAWGYYASGAGSESTVRANRAAWAEVELAYRVLVDVSQRTMARTVLGQSVPAPIFGAPTAFHGLAHPDAELATARGTDSVMCLSTLSNTAVEEVVAAAAGQVWFQLYVYRDRGAAKALVERVEAAGCSALVVTVDAPVIGQRKADVRNRFHLPEGLTMPNVGVDLPPVNGSALQAHFVSLLDQSLEWNDLDWLASITRLPILLKGVVRADDALRARDHGMAGVVVSNHGGRQLDGAVATARALPSIAQAVGGDLEVFVDGGIRSGHDVLRALALGAGGVFVGRPVLHGLAWRGQQGVAWVHDTLRRELDEAMALAGCPRIEAIGPWLIA